MNKAGWRKVKFGEVVRLSKARCADPLAEGVERFVGLEHLQPGDLRIRSWGNVADGTTFTSVFKPGQVLFGKRRAYQRKVAVADFSGVCSGDIYVLEPINPVRPEPVEGREPSPFMVRQAHHERLEDAPPLMPELLPFICQTDAFFEHAVGTSAGSLSPRTNWSSLADFEFALPPIDEQQRIAELLTAIDAVNDEYLSLILQSASTQTAMLLNDINRDWPSAIIAEIGEVITGKTPPTSMAECWGDEIGFATPADLGFDTGYLTKTERKISVLGVAYSRVVPANAVLVVCIGSTIGKIAQTSERTAFNQQINAVICRLVDPNYFYAVCTNIGAELCKRSGTTAVPIINKGQFEKIEIPLPPLELQIEIGERFKKMAEMRKTFENRRESLLAFRNIVVAENLEACK